MMTMNYGFSGLNAAGNDLYDLIETLRDADAERYWPLYDAYSALSSALAEMLTVNRLIRDRLDALDTLPPADAQREIRACADALFAPPRPPQPPPQYDDQPF